MNKPETLTTSYAFDKMSWIHLSEDDDFMEYIRTHFGHQLADRIFQECQSGEKIVTVGDFYVHEILKLCQVEVKEYVTIHDLVRCKDCKHWLGIEEESPACAPCDAYDDDTPFTKMIMTPRYGFCYKGEPKDGIK